jgi:hypothetical protein
MNELNAKDWKKMKKKSIISPVQRVLILVHQKEFHPQLTGNVQLAQPLLTTF